MICPRCKFQNAKDSLKCQNCSLNLKIKCPNCDKLTQIGKKNCEHCNYLLVKFCPSCKSANHPKAPACRKCGTEFSSIETRQTQKIPKQEKEVSKTETLEQETKKEPKKLKPYAIISAELINIKPLKVKIKNEQFFKKLVNKFYQVSAKYAYQTGEKAIRSDVNTMVVKFKKPTEIQHSCYNAIFASTKIINEINEINRNLYAKLKIKLKVKIGICLCDDAQHKPFATNERACANANEIIVGQQVKKLTEEKVNFLKSKKRIGDNIFFIVENKELELVKEEQETPKEPIKEVKKESKKQPEEEYKGPTQSRQEVTNQLISIIKSEDTKGKLVSISAPDGAGKTSLVFSTMQLLDQEPCLWIVGNCIKDTNYPFSFFQSLLKNMFSLPLFNVNTEESKENIIKTFKEQVGFNDEENINQLLKIIFPDTSSDSKEFYTNRNKSLLAIQSLLTTLASKNKIILLIEDIDSIDQDSFNCIQTLINNNLLDQNFNIIITRKSHYNIENYFFSENLSEENTFNFHLSDFTTQEFDIALSDFFNQEDLIPENIKRQIYKNSKGLPIYAEEVVMLLLQTGLIAGNETQTIIRPEVEGITLPVSLEEIIRVKVNNIAQSSQDALKTIGYAAQMGMKFMPGLIQTLLNKDDQEFSEILQILVTNGLVVPFDNFNYMFKNTILWNTIKEFGLNDEQKFVCQQNILKVLEQYTLSNAATLAKYAQYTNNNDKAFQYWTQASHEAISAGDMQAYSFALESLINLIDSVEIENPEEIKYKTFEEYGKLNFKTNPQKAIDFLAKAINIKEEQNDSIKVIELSGYLARCCEMTGNYSGSVECVDKAIAQLEKEKEQRPIEYALLLYAKLESLFKMGQAQEIINIMETEILPVLQNALTENKTIEGLSIADIGYISLEAELIQAKAYAIQGNSNCIVIAQRLIEEANKLNIPDIVAQANLVAALYYSLQKDIKQSNNILINIQNIIPHTIDKRTIALYRNIINVINNMQINAYKGILEDFENIRDLALSCGEKNIDLLLQAFYAKIVKEQGRETHTEAIDIYNHALQVSSEKKLAISALLLWYYLAELYLDTNDIDSAEQIAIQALEITKTPRINNYYFAAKLKNLIAKIFIAKEDFESAKMHIEENIQLTQQYNIAGLQSEAYMIFGQLFKIVSEKNNRPEILENAKAMFNQATSIAKTLENDFLLVQIEKVQSMS